MNSIKKRTAAFMVDLFLAPLTLIAGPILWAVRRVGLERLPFCKRLLLSIGVFPIRRHYYEPLFDTESLRSTLHLPRELPGLNLDLNGQLALLADMRYADELLELPLEPNGPTTFHYHNPRFGPGDAELLYSIIRRYRPRRLVEIGSGFSTLVARLAIKKNSEVDREYTCEHVCIEPYEEPWLEQCGASVVRKRVEDIDRGIFRNLQSGDILFIDSSHIIRPSGDVLCEYLQILPALNRGVLVHIHDIFTPLDYPAVWVCDEIRLWNEQYLLEAFLSHNAGFRILCALNHLKRLHPGEVAAAFPVLGREMWREPGSFWIQRV